MKSRVLSPVLALTTALSLALVGCGKEDPPSLPPSDSMEIPAFGADTSGALSLQGSPGANYQLAAGAVGFVTGALWLALLPPRSVFLQVLAQRAEQDGDDWVWTKNYLLGNTAELRGRVQDGLQLELHFTGTVGQSTFDDFIWFTGQHHATEGQWVFYDPTAPTDAVLTIDWARASATDKDLVFTAVKQGVDTYGDSISYSLKGTTASMTLHDALNSQGVEATFSVEWDTADGSGMMTGADSATYCWDTLTNDQVDIACPAP